MKRNLAIALSVIMLCLCFCGCGGDKDNGDKILSLAKQGKMTEAEFDLGTKPTTIKKAYTGEKSESLIEQKGQTTVKFTTDNFDYHYEITNEDKGISVMVNFGDAYGFKNGETVSSDITNVIKGEYTLSPATENQMYFLRGEVENCEVLSYKCGNCRLDFYFIDYFLSATVLVDTRYWKD